MRRVMHNTILDLKGAIRVFARVRPGPEEAEASVRVGDSGALELLTVQGRSACATSFSFDRVFASSSTQV